MKHTLAEIVKGTTAILDYVCQGIAYYRITVDGTIYQFQVDSLDELYSKNVFYLPQEKSIVYMRWIRLSMEKGNFLQLN